MPNSRQPLRLPRQQGAALIMALIVLIAVTFISLASLSGSLLELKMAGNEEARATAFQIAQAAIDSITGRSDINLVVKPSTGYTDCSAYFASVSRDSTTCGAYTLTLDSSFDPPNISAARITRLLPELARPPRGADTSCEIYSVALFGIEGYYNNTAGAGGYNGIVQGFLKLVPKQGQGNQ